MVDFLRIVLIFCTIFITAQTGFTQKSFTYADSLRGSLRPERTAYDVHYYHLNLEVNPKKGSISGYNSIEFHYTGEHSETLQLDLFSEFIVDSIVSGNLQLDYTRDGNAIFVQRPEKPNMRIYYHGQPRIAPLPPWEGGFIWAKDENNKDWVGVACEGLGASSWWPLKDHLSDTPDSMRLSFTVPAGLMCVSNGNLEDTLAINNERTQWNWFVSCPISSYNVTFNLGDFRNFHQTYSGLSGLLEIDYYILASHVKKAQRYFPVETARMLKAFEHYFGAYPCYKDGFGLVETPYYGMEHQGAIAYGNNFRKVPGYGFDFILVHESGHEWWGNSLRVSDYSEMWIHEGFTTYAEALYLEYYSGKKKSIQYLNKQKQNIQNSSPMLGPMGVNYDDWGNSDIYYKGTWFLHTLRSVIRNDSLWLGWLRTFCEQQHQSNVHTDQILSSLEAYTSMRLKPVFQQYLEDTRIPILQLSKSNEGIWKSTWTHCREDFSMPVIAGKSGIRIDPEGIKKEKIRKFNKRWIREIKNNYLIDIEI